MYNISWLYQITHTRLSLCLADRMVRAVKKGVITMHLLTTGHIVIYSLLGITGVAYYFGFKFAPKEPVAADWSLPEYLVNNIHDRIKASDHDMADYMRCP